MELHRDKIEAAGLRLVTVGLGEPKHAQRYCRSLGPLESCFIDPTAKAYEAYGLGRGRMSQFLNHRVLTSGVRAAAKGHRQGKATGDEKILGGTFIVNRQGIVEYAYYSDFPGDNPDLGKLLGGEVLTGSFVRQGVSSG